VQNSYPSSVFDIFDVRVVVVRLALAIVFGAIVGVEREWRHKAAGIKTNTLVALGAATFAMMTNTFGPQNHNPAQMAAAVVSGIGFIGAGVIIHRGASVQGVTTAATLWANASVGVAVGLGYITVAGAAVVGMLIVQFGIRRIEREIDRRAPQVHEVELRIECDEQSLAAVNGAWLAFVSSAEIVSLRRTTSRTPHGLLWRAVFVTVPARRLDLTTIEESVVRLPGIHTIEARQTSQTD
jgi:putative Mg2+ transporter-C (MgtC) family protein